MAEPLAAATRAELRTFAGKALLFSSGRCLALVLGAETQAAGAGVKSPLPLPAALTVDALHMVHILKALLVDRPGGRGAGGRAVAPTLLPLILGLQEVGEGGAAAAAAAGAGGEGGDRLSTPLLLRFAFRTCAAGADSASAVLRGACAVLTRGLGELAFTALCGRQ